MREEKAKLNAWGSQAPLMQWPSTAPHDVKT